MYIRLAKEYLASMQSEEDVIGSDEEDNEEEARGITTTSVISDRLRNERLDSQGKYFRNIAESVGGAFSDGDTSQRYLSGHEVSQLKR